jgi:hypothetical protein
MPRCDRVKQDQLPTSICRAGCMSYDAVQFVAALDLARLSVVVSTMTGSLAVLGSALMRRKKSTPSMGGSLMARTRNCWPSAACSARFCSDCAWETGKKSWKRHVRLASWGGQDE